MSQKEDLLHYFQLLHQQIVDQVKGMSEEAIHWRPNEEFNTPAILLTHLMGAERYWIWEAVGGRQIERDRDDEFVDKANETRQDLLDAFVKTRQTSMDILSLLDEADLDENCIIVNPEHARRLIQEGDQSKRWAIVRHIQHQALHYGHLQLLNRLYRQQSV